MSYGDYQGGGGYPPQGGGYPPQGGGGYPPQQGGFPPPQQYGYGGGGYGSSMQHADIGKRIFAVIIDGFLGALMTVPGYILFFIAIATGANGGRDMEGVAVLFMLLGYALIFIGAIGWMIFQIYRLGRDGATLGKKWMKIKVLDQAGQPLGFGKAFLRELVKGALGGVCFILLLWPMWDPNKQGLWDKVSNSNVYNA
jgi:uncharacterized RDD family membrane protein YckC